MEAVTKRPRISRFGISDSLPSHSSIKTCPDNDILTLNVDDVNGIFDEAAESTGFSQSLSCDFDDDVLALEEAELTLDLEGQFVMCLEEDFKDKIVDKRASSSKKPVSTSTAIVENASRGVVGVDAKPDIGNVHLTVQKPAPTLPVVDTAGFSIVCPYCLQVFTRNQINEFNLHCRKVHDISEVVKPAVLKDDKGKVTCKWCKMIFPDRGALATHIRCEHVDKILKCLHCERLFTSESLLARHSRIHSELRPYRCEHCEKTFPWPEHLKAHSVIHTKTDKKWQCDKCSQAFSSNCALRKHERTHSTTFRYRCQHCDMGFHVSEPYKIHLRQHEGIRPFECGVCSQKFFSRGACKRHVERHNDPSVSYQCRSCDRIYKDRQTCLRHEACHVNPRPWLCKRCGFCLSTKYNLIEHLKKIHHFDTVPLELLVKLPGESELKKLPNPIPIPAPRPPSVIHDGPVTPNRVVRPPSKQLVYVVSTVENTTRPKRKKQTKKKIVAPREQPVQRSELSTGKSSPMKMSTATSSPNTVDPQAARAANGLSELQKLILVAQGHYVQNNEESQIHFTEPQSQNNCDRFEKCKKKYMTS